VLILWRVRVHNQHQHDSISSSNREVQVRLVKVKVGRAADWTKILRTLRLPLLLVQMNVRHLYQREGINNDSPHHLYQPVHSSKLLWPLLIFTLLLFLHLQPPLFFSNPESSDSAHSHGHPHTTSSFHSRSRLPVDSTPAISHSSSPERSPSRTSLDFPNGGTNRGRPPPTHPDRKPHHLQQQDHHNPILHVRSQSYPYPDPFAGSGLGFKHPPPQEHPTDVNESFKKFTDPLLSAVPRLSLIHSLLRLPPLPST